MGARGVVGEGWGAGGFYQLIFVPWLGINRGARVASIQRFFTGCAKQSTNKMAFRCSSPRKNFGFFLCNTQNTNQLNY